MRSHSLSKVILLGLLSLAVAQINIVDDITTVESEATAGGGVSTTSTTSTGRGADPTKSVAVLMLNKADAGRSVVFYRTNPVATIGEHLIFDALKPH